MDRRKFLIGMGSLAAGSATMLGTSATTTFNLNDRQVGANVVTDSAGAVKLDDSTSGDIVTQNASGELEIDFANGSADGVNIGSVVDVGDYESPNGDGTAFRIVNQTTSTIDLEVDFVPNGDYNVENADGSVLRFGVQRNSFGTQLTDISDAVSADWSSPDDGDTVSSGDPVRIFDENESVSLGSDFDPDTDEGFAAGTQVFVAFQVDADQPGSSTDDNLSGVLDITATQPPTDT